MRGASRARRLGAEKCHPRAALLGAALLLAVAAVAGRVAATLGPAEPHLADASLLAEAVADARATSRAQDGPPAPRPLEGPPAPRQPEGPPAPALPEGPPRPAQPTGPTSPGGSERPPTPAVPPEGPATSAAPGGWEPVGPGDVAPARPQATALLLPPRSRAWCRVMTTPEALAPCPVCLGLERVSAGPVSMTVGGPEAPLKAVYNATVVAPVPAGPCERTLRVRLCLLTDAGAAGQCSSFQPIPGEMVEGSKLTFAAELPATANVALDLRCGREGGGETEVTVLMLPRWGIGAQR